MADQPVSDADRKRFEENLAAALLLLYRGSHQAALTKLGVLESAGAISPATLATIEQKAAKHAQLVQTGINQRIAKAVNDLPPEASDADAQAAAGQARVEIHEHNRDVLMPFLVSWATHAGLVDAYQETPSSSGDPEKTAADDTLWNWVQTLVYSDECEEADAMSPAPLDDLLAVTGSPPPIHDRCACYLEPVA